MSARGRWLAAILAVAGGMAPTAPAAAAPVCENGAILGTPVKGSAQLGEYAGVPLPSNFKDARNETHVDAMFMAIYVMSRAAEWPCVQKYFPEAAAIFERHMRH